jgi:hypothetical protein
MTKWINTVRGALTLKTTTFASFRDQNDAFFRGFLLILVVSLIVGLPYLVIDTITGINGEFSDREMADVTAGIQQGLDQALPWMTGIPDEVLEEIMAQMREGLTMGMRVGQEITSLPTLLPRPLSAFLEAFGSWASRPFADSGFPLASAALGTWLGYGILVMLAAKLLGGVSNMARFFGTTSLFAVPHFLKLLSPIPIIGGILGFVALTWGVVIYVKATAVSHELTIERALLAVFLPMLLLGLLFLLVGLGMGGIIAFLIAVQ